ncbi:alpha/beta hydrolase [Geotalea sp. SG265]|uniref:alpha/beta fold hydrolase n=1 Tax=Geotalea sp. SG265 TaxID=2922867 RepID=UPI001FAF90BA|nr:alpha/beta hydrolase [Geotalea sp. SG265]
MAPDSECATMTSFKRNSFRIKGRTVHAIEAGNGPLVIALHGFPDLPISFRHQIPFLAQCGYRVVAPCLRGYFPNDNCQAGSLEVATLVLDLLDLIDHLTDQPATLMGHDWGATVVRGASIIAPEKVARIICMSVPTPGNFAKALMSNPLQQRRSWYAYFFQLPFAELAVAENDLAFIERLWQEWSPGWHCPKDVMEEVKGAFRHPSVLKAALEYYRSQFNPTLQHPGLAEIRKRLSEPIPVPTMYLHGADDGCIGAETTEGMENSFLGHFERYIISAAGHFVHQEQPGIINELIVGFLSSGC